MNRLLVNPGTPQAWEIELKPGVNRIGRNEDNDFTINHTSVSGTHCEITVSEAGIFLKDLGSTNGTFVNRGPVREAWLKPGQHVQFGPVDMTFESDTVSAAAPTAPPSPPIPITVPVPSHVPPAPAGLRITKGHAESRPPAPPPPTPVQSAQSRFNQPPVAETNGKKPNFALSLGGVVLGAILGMTIWHLVYRFTGWRIGFMALATGCLAGVAPQLIGHYRSKWMGLIAAFVTLLAIFGAQFLNAKVQFAQFMDETESDGYTEQVAYAKRAVEAIPTGTDEEMRAFLAKENSDEEGKVKPEEIDVEDLRELKEQLPKLRDLAAGKISKEQYGQELRDGSAKLEESGVFKIYLLIRTLGIFNIVNIFLGVGAAYLTAKGDGKN